MQVPSTRESKSRHGALTTLEQTQVGAFSVAVHPMSLTLVAEETSIGRESQHVVHARGMFTTVRLQVGVQVFAIRWVSELKDEEVNHSLKAQDSLVGTFLGGRGVRAGLLASGERAVIFSVILRSQVVVVVVSWVPGLSTVLGLGANRVSHG